MKTLQVGRQYPIKGPELKTKKDKFGKRYSFAVTNVVIYSRNIVRVMGQDSMQAWCRVDYKFKEMPKWLKAELKTVTSDLTSLN